MRPHWNNCIMHADTEVDDFIGDYFAGKDRHCLLVAGAGFDPRARKVAAKLSAALSDRLHGFLIREERFDPADSLRTSADENERAMRKLVPAAHVVNVRVFDPQDGAPVGGQRIAEALSVFVWPPRITDVVLDMSALSTGVGFPTARFLLESCEAREDVSFHVMISSNPELDAQIVGEPYSTPTLVRGFAGRGANGILPVARIWLPQLASGRLPTLNKILASQSSPYKICPILPFPARNPRRADDLIAEFLPLLQERAIDARDFIYVSERNPLDTYRKLSTLKRRYDRTVEDVYDPELLLSPVGSKVMAVGAMMAAIEHDLPVQHVENVRYDYDPQRVIDGAEPDDLTVHIWLHGPTYAGYGGAQAPV
jgi:hypothetical protein